MNSQRQAIRLCHSLWPREAGAWSAAPRLSAGSSRAGPRSPPRCVLSVCVSGKHFAFCREGVPRGAVGGEGGVA